MISRSYTGKKKYRINQEALTFPFPPGITSRVASTHYKQCSRRNSPGKILNVRFLHCTTCLKAKPVQNFKQAVLGKSVKTCYNLFVFSGVGTVCSQTLWFQGACSHMFVNVGKKSTTELKYSSNRREILRGGGPFATDRRKLYISYPFFYILSAGYTDIECSLARKQEL